MSANSPIVCVADPTFSNQETVTKNTRCKRNDRRRAKKKGTTHDKAKLPNAMETDDNEEEEVEKRNANTQATVDDEATESDQSDIIGGEHDAEMEAGEGSDAAQDHLSQRVQEMDIDADIEEETDATEKMDDEEEDEAKAAKPIKKKPEKKARRGGRRRGGNNKNKQKEAKDESRKEEMDEDDEENEDENEEEKEKEQEKEEENEEEEEPSTKAAISKSRASRNVKEKEQEKEEENEEEEEPSTTATKGKSRASRNVKKSKARAPQKRRANRVKVAPTSDDENEDINVDDNHDTKKKKTTKKPKARRDGALNTLDHFKPKRGERFVCGKTVMIEPHGRAEPNRGWVQDISKDQVLVRCYVVDPKTNKEKTREKWYSKNSKKIYIFNRRQRD
eukprot:CAMPEP_0197079986 /NCGR_PEP_ID=MMETSP1384-20130603/213901_1 /TAXON_ID=29189 /ORGANISM="Ammonia sp." /LENGTH=390 /DNA_ID=CAMNT_0042518867 /DNA_START=102 /DNA_END=1274 /DNA_ORIENTATION=-